MKCVSSSIFRCFCSVFSIHTEFAKMSSVTTVVSSTFVCKLLYYYVVGALLLKCKVWSANFKCHSCSHWFLFCVSNVLLVHELSSREYFMEIQHEMYRFNGRINQFFEVLTSLLCNVGASYFLQHVVFHRLSLRFSKQRLRKNRWKLRRHVWWCCCCCCCNIYRNMYIRASYQDAHTPIHSLHKIRSDVFFSSTSLFHSDFVTGSID